MNRLLEHIIAERSGHYIHALELSSCYEYKRIIEQIVSDYKEQFTIDEITDFFKSIELYHYYDESYFSDGEGLSEEQQENDEEGLYNFDYIQCIKDCYYQ